MDLSRRQTAICVVDSAGAIIAETKVTTCPNVIASWLAPWTGSLDRIGRETGPIAVWLWNVLSNKRPPIVRMAARHASAALKMTPSKTDRHDARGLAQIVRTGWFKAARIKSHGACVVRALLTARDTLVGVRVRLENEVPGLLRTFGGMCDKRVGGFLRRAEEVIAGARDVEVQIRAAARRSSS